MAWSVLTHGDLPPLPGRPLSAPLDHRLADGHVPSAPPLPPIEAERIARQREIARVARHAAERVQDRRRRQMLADRALLVEVADSSDRVLELLAELEGLGVKVERRQR
jgi:hypothetical protein